MRQKTVFVVRKTSGEEIRAVMNKLTAPESTHFGLEKPAHLDVSEEKSKKESQERS